MVKMKWADVRLFVQIYQATKTLFSVKIYIYVYFIYFPPAQHFICIV